MRHLFSAEGEAALVATMARRPLLAFDFDGTLAPIVARPDDARVPAAVERHLERLGRALSRSHRRSANTLMPVATPATNGANLNLIARRP